MSNNNQICDQGMVPKVGTRAVFNFFAEPLAWHPNQSSVKRKEHCRVIYVVEPGYVPTETVCGRVRKASKYYRLLVVEVDSNPVRMHFIKLDPTTEFELPKDIVDLPHEEWRFL